MAPAHTARGRQAPIPLPWARVFALWGCIVRSKREMVNTRVNDAEKRALALLAEAEARTPSATIRELIRQEARRRGLWTDARKEAA